MAARSQALHLQVPVGRRDISCCSVKMCRKAPSPLRGCRRRPGCACCVQTARLGRDTRPQATCACVLQPRAPMRFISGRHKAPAKEAHKKRQGMHALPFWAEREEPVSLRCPRGAPPRAKCRTCGGKPYKTCFAWKNRIVRKFRLYPAQSRAEAPLHGRAAIPPHTR